MKDPAKRAEDLNLIVLDMNLPKYDGLDIFLEIKGMPRMENACLAIYSSSNDEFMRNSLFKEGAYYLINKKLQLEAYFAKISELYSACIGSKI